MLAGNWFTAVAKSAKMTDFRFMKSMRSSLGLGMVWAVLACVPAWGQHDTPSRKAQKAYADAQSAPLVVLVNERTVSAAEAAPIPGPMPVRMPM